MGKGGSSQALIYTLFAQGKSTSLLSMSHQIVNYVQFKSISITPTLQKWGEVRQELVFFLQRGFFLFIVKIS